MTVYLPNSTDGQYTEIDTQAIKCRLAITDRAGTAVASERGNVGTDRRLIWSANYAMPNEAQVEICGERWNVEPGTYAAVTGPDFKTVHYHRCEVTKVL